MISPCGFRCDRCVAHKDNARTHADRVRGSAAWARYFGLQVPPQRMQCNGCLAADRGGHHYPDKKCPIRPCALGRGLKSCADCADYPCAELESRMAYCDEVVRRFQGAIRARDFERFVAPYDCRANLDGLRKRSAT